MTAKAKRIRTYFLVYSASLTAGLTHTSTNVDQFTAQADITIIGFELNAYVYLQNPVDSGTIEIEVQLTRGGWQNPGILATTIANCFGRQTTEGVNVGVNWGSDLNKEKTVMFPEGYGIDMDSGEVLQMMECDKNDMAQTHWVWTFAIIYYVER